MGWVVRDPAIETVCPCGTPIVVVHTSPRTVAAIEPVEFEFPVTRCPVCKDERRARVTCGRCLGLGHIGGVTPHTAVALDERDRARPWHRGVPLRRGEGLYPRHLCRRCDVAAYV